MSKEIISNRVQKYLQSLVPPRPKEILRMEAHAARTGFPIIGPTCGYICYQMARMINARQIFELGSGFGYSAAWFARAVRENGGGKVYHVEWDSELSSKARAHLNRLGYGDIVIYKVGEAIKALKQTKGFFDLIFNDIDKEGYPDSLPVIAEKLRSGGVLIVDNLLWDGKVFDLKNHETSTVAIRKFTKLIVDDPSWIVTLVPIRDGLLIAYKR